MPVKMCKNVFCWELNPQYAVDRHATSLKATHIKGATI